MEPVESEEVMTVGGGCTAGGLAMRGGTVHCTRRGPALPGGDYDFSGHFTLHMEKAGLESKAQSIVFSLPVTDTAGMRLMEEMGET